MTECHVEVTSLYLFPGDLSPQYLTCVPDCDPSLRFFTILVEALLAFNLCPSTGEFAFDHNVRVHMDFPKIPGPLRGINIHASKFHRPLLVSIQAENVDTSWREYEGWTLKWQIFVGSL